MQVSDFNFELPSELIAQHPLPTRSGSRLLQLNRSTGEITHRQFADLPGLLDERDLLVFNDTRVIPARLFGRKADSGGHVEVLVERVTGARTALAQIRASKSPKAGTRLLIDELGEGDGDHSLTVTGRLGDLYEIESEVEIGELLRSAGHIPLPPYIKRDGEAADEAEDIDRYQTVYAREDGAVAAPTAGLHFDAALLGQIAERGVASTYCTLHVGAGTFQPVRVESVTEHVMHNERYTVSTEVCAAVVACRERGGRVIAVGTTSVRSLESAAASGELVPTTGDTDIFIYPGYKFRVVDGMITNFHLPSSTLIMLVAAFAGLPAIKQAYAAAIAEKYRFFSYGDAMLIADDPDANPQSAAGT